MTPLCLRPKVKALRRYRRRWLDEVQEGAVRLMQAEAVSAFGMWIEGLADWDYFVTRTFAPGYTTMGFTKPGIKSALKMVKDLQRITNANRMFAVMEWQEDREVPHVHALLECDGVDKRWMNDRDWSVFGMARWLDYNKLGGASAYVAKYIVKQHDVHDVEWWFYEEETWVGSGMHTGAISG